MTEKNLLPEDKKLAQEEMAAMIAKKAKEKDMSAEDVNKAVEQYLNEPLKSEKNTEIEKAELLNETQTAETLVDMGEKAGKDVPAAKQEQELKNEMGQVKKVYVTAPSLVGLAGTSAHMVADYIKDNNIDVVNEAKEFIKNAPDTAVEAVNKSVDFVQEQATKGYEAAKAGTQKGFEIIKDGVQDSVDFVKGGVNFVKDSLDYINPFTLNDTLNNAGQKVNPDATEQTPIVRDNSKGMA